MGQIDHEGATWLGYAAIACFGVGLAALRFWLWHEAALAMIGGVACALSARLFWLAEEERGTS